MLLQRSHSRVQGVGEGETVAIIFCTTVTPDYLWRAAPLLASLRRLLSCRKVVVSVGFDMPASDWYETVRLEPTGSVCNQQGQVLDVIPGLTNGDTLIMADADAVVQRNLSLEEIGWLSHLASDQVAAGPNRQADENGLQEIELLRPKLSPGETGRLLGSPLSDVPIHNCGFLAAKLPVWQQLRPSYEALAAKAADKFGNWRCCQLLLCTVIYQLGLRVQVISQEVHSHGHSGAWPGHEVREGRLYADGKLVFFAHHIAGVEYST